MFFREKPYEVICIGSTSKDIFFPTGEGIILETPEDITAKEKVAFELGGKYRVDDRYEAVGGVAANVSRGLARLGHRAACYSKVGEDELGRWIIGELEKDDVATDLLFVDPNVKTDLSAIIVLTQNGERTIFHNRDANERLEISAERLKDTRWLFVSALNGDWRGNLGKILAAKETSGWSLALNPGQHNIRDDAALLFRTLAQTNLLLLNKDEAIELLLHAPQRPGAGEIDDERYLVTALHAAGARVVALTDGKRGAWAYDGTAFWHCPIHTLHPVVDSTGAGDAFGAGFFGAWLAGRPLEDALRFGMANSGSVVGFYGAGEGLLAGAAIEAVIPDIRPERIV